MEANKINMFIKPIFDKKHEHDLFSYIKLKRLLRKLKKISPSYDMMMEIYNFIKLIEKIYMYGNDENHFLFSATVPKGYNGAMIYKEENFEIIYVLKNDNNHIDIKLNRSSRKNNYDEIISFNEGDSVINDIYDEQKFVFIIACLMNGLTELITYYYKNKKL